MLSDVSYTQQLSGGCKHGQLCHMNALLARRIQGIFWLKTRCARRRFKSNWTPASHHKSSMAASSVTLLLFCNVGIRSCPLGKILSLCETPGPPSTYRRVVNGWNINFGSTIPLRKRERETKRQNMRGLAHVPKVCSCISVLNSLRHCESICSSPVSNLRGGGSMGDETKPPPARDMLF